MWHEARRQSRKIRGMIINYRKRAERRRDYYEKTKIDPVHVLQIYGRQCKIHIAAENSVMTLCNGQIDDIIDRYDVRAHLDFVTSEDNQEEVEEPFTYEERQINYERYRILAQNSFLKIPEEKFLNQLHLEEQFGCTTKKGAFNYEEDNQEDSDLSDSDPDIDLIINTIKLDTIEANDLNKHGCNYGMTSNDFYSFIINDIEEAKALKLAREELKEQAMFSRRKSRRERKTNREKILDAAKTLHPQRSKSSSRSSSPLVSGKITYITSFGGDEEPSTSKSKNKASSRNRSYSTSSSSSSLNRYKKYRRSYTPSYSSSTSTSPNKEHIKILPRYYGRKKIHSSSSNSSDKTESFNKNNLIKKSSTNLIIKRLKRKRQVLINKQFKADKIAENVKTQLQKDKKIKLRKRQREIRYGNESVSSSTECNSSSSEPSRNSTTSRLVNY